MIVLSSLLVSTVGCGSSGDEPQTSSVESSVVDMQVAATSTTTTETTTTTTTSTTTTSTTIVPTTAATTTTTVTPTTTAAPATTVAPTTATTTVPLPGVPVDWLVAGTVAHVPGVAVGETFAIRVLPGDGQAVAASLPPLTELVLTGDGRDLDQGGFSITWAEVTAGGVTGWISLWSLVYLGAARDLTAEAVAAFGQLPTAPTMLDLGTMVADAVAPLDPASAGAERVRAADPGAGPSPEVVYDQFPGEDYGDDAARGSRLRIVGRQLAAGTYELVSVDERSLCTRGVTATGVCV